MKDRKVFFEVYREYLKSEKWSKKRDAVMKRDGGICQACLKEPATQVHHKTYKNVFEEPLFDLVAICDKCHKQIHDKRTWKDRAAPYFDSRLVEYQGRIGVVISYHSDGFDVVTVQFRDGGIENLFIWEPAFLD